MTARQRANFGIACLFSGFLLGMVMMGIVYGTSRPGNLRAEDRVEPRSVIICKVNIE